MFALSPTYVGSFTSIKYMYMYLHTYVHMYIYIRSLTCIKDHSLIRNTEGEASLCSQSSQSHIVSIILSTSPHQPFSKDALAVSIHSYYVRNHSSSSSSSWRRFSLVFFLPLLVNIKVHALIRAVAHFVIVGVSTPKFALDPAREKGKFF